MSKTKKVLLTTLFICLITNFLGCMRTSKSRHKIPGSNYSLVTVTKRGHSFGCCGITKTTYLYYKKDKNKVEIDHFNSMFDEPFYEVNNQLDAIIYISNFNTELLYNLKLCQSGVLVQNVFAKKESIRFVDQVVMFKDKDDKEFILKWDGTILKQNK